MIWILALLACAQTAQETGNDAPPPASLGGECYEDGGALLWRGPSVAGAVPVVMVTISSGGDSWIAPASDWRIMAGEVLVYCGEDIEAASAIVHWLP